MEPDGDSDAMSLRDLATNHRDEPRSTSNLDTQIGGVNRDTDNKRDELDGIPDCFKDYKELLESPPVFSRQSRSWIRLQRWQQGPLTIILCLWMVIYCHRALTLQFDADPSNSNVRWLPAVLATLFMATTAYVVHGELHWLDQQPVKQQHYGELKIGLISTLMFVVYFIAPLLSLPIFHSFRRSMNIENMSDYATLSSWIDIIPNFSGSLPALVDRYEIDNARGDWIKSSVDHWVVDNSKLKAKFPDAITFTLPRSGRGTSEKVWNGVEDGDKVGVYMPVLPISQPIFDKMQLEHDWQVKTQVLAFGLDCEYIHPEGLSVINASEPGSISVKASDTLGCSSVVTLAGMVFDEGMNESAQRLLDHVEKQQNEENRGGASFEAVTNFIEGYRRLLVSGSQVIAYKPTWSTATGEASAALNDICRSKLFVVALSRSFMREDFKPQAPHIQAAICTAKYNLADVILKLRRIGKGLFYPRSGMPYEHTSVSFDEVQVIREDLYSKRPMMDEDVHKELNDAFMRDASSGQIQGTQWPLAHFREEFGDKFWLRPKPVGSLLMACKFITRSFVSKLSTAAGLTLQEGLPPGLPPNFQSGNKSEVHILTPNSETSYDSFQGYKIRREVFQSQLIFTSTLYLASIFFSVLLFLLGFINRGFYRNEHCSPWDLTSIAARAALLRNSRVKSLLRLQKMGSRKLKSPVSLRVGYWSVHEEQGKNGWRVDSATGDFPDLDLDMNSLEWKWEDLRSSPEIATPDTFFPSSLGFILHLFLHGFMLVVSPFTRAADQEARWTSIRLGYTGTICPWYIWIFLSIIFPSFLFGLAFAWLPFLYNFYRCRQPWVAMKTAQPAQRSITLDYWNSWFPLWKAFRNRHWLVVSLALGTLVQFCIPLSSSLLYNPRLSSSPTERFTAIRRYTWRDEIVETSVAAQADFNYALNRLLCNMISCYQQSSWLSQQGALASIDTSGLLPTDEATYGTLNTSLLSAHLECDEAEISLALLPNNVTEGHGFSVEYLDFSSMLTTNAIEARLSDPCSPTSLDSDRDGQLLKKASSSRQYLCSRWWLHNTSSILDGVRPTWLIAIIQGHASKSDQTGPMLFDREPSATGLICRPMVKTKAGIATFSIEYSGTDTDRATDVIPARFDPSAGEPKLLDRLALAISYGLNSSITSLNHTDGGVLADGNLISSNAFVGDILSYTLHRFFHADRPLALNNTNLKQAVSLIFSSYVSSLASETELLKDYNFSENVEVKYFRVDLHITTNWILFSFLLVYIIFCTYLLIKYGIKPPRQYLLPFAPEPLLQGLRLLCHSQIVSRMEREMPHPEKLSLRSFHQQVEDWGLTYKLGTVEVDGHTHVVVDSAAEVGDAGYRDEPDRTDDELDRADDELDRADDESGPSTEQNQ